MPSAEESPGIGRLLRPLVAEFVDDGGVELPGVVHLGHEAGLVGRPMNGGVDQRAVAKASVSPMEITPLVTG
jgi:hypothetical protein